MTSAATRARSFFDASTTLGRRRIVGVVLLAALLGTFHGVSDPPRLDDVRDAVLAEHQGSDGADEYYGNQVGAVGTDNCFQGFCYGAEESLSERWLDFSVAYLKVVGWVLAVAFLAAALVDSFLFPTAEGPGLGRRGLRLARPLTTLSAPALTMIFVLFTPVLFVSRLAMGLVAVLGVGAMVARTWGGAGEAAGALPEIDSPEGGVGGWGTVLWEGLKRTALAMWRFTYRLAPLFVVVALAGGLVIQYVTLDDVEAVVGDHLLGVVIAAAVGLAVDLWRLWAIPLVAGLVLIGMGTAPAAALLFTAAAGGAFVFHRIGQETDRTAALRYMAAIGVIGIVGGALVLAWQGVASATAATPTITFDGVTCTYDGPDELAPGTHAFVIRNRMPFTADTERLPTAFVVGRIAEGATIEGFTADVAADPHAPLPAYFSEAGTKDFIFPDTTETVQFVIDAPGRYASVCVEGAMAVAPEVFRVEG